MTLKRCSPRREPSTPSSSVCWRRCPRSTRSRPSRRVARAARVAASTPRRCSCRRLARSRSTVPAAPSRCASSHLSWSPRERSHTSTAGGWTLGENDLQNPRLDRLALETGLTVVSVGYRLARENPYPAAPGDGETAALWLLGKEGKATIGRASRLAIGGDSAGAQLAAVTLLRLRDRHGMTGAFGAAVLQYGSFDLSMTPSQRLWGGRNLGASAPI